MNATTVMAALGAAAFVILLDRVGLVYTTALIIVLVTGTIVKFGWYRWLFGSRGAGGAVR